MFRESAGEMYAFRKSGSELLQNDGSKYEYTSCKYHPFESSDPSARTDLGLPSLDINPEPVRRLGETTEPPYDYLLNAPTMY